MRSSHDSSPRQSVERISRRRLHALSVPAGYAASAADTYRLFDHARCGVLATGPAAVAQGGYLSAERHWPLPATAGALRRRPGTRRTPAAVIVSQGALPARFTFRCLHVHARARLHLPRTTPRHAASHASQSPTVHALPLSHAAP